MSAANQPSAASLLAQIAADRDATAAEKLAELLGGGEG